MKTLRSQTSSAKFDVDHCSNCSSYWFDRGELVAVTGYNDSAALISSEGRLGNSAEFALAYIQYQKHQAALRENWFRMLAVAAIGANVVLCVIFLTVATKYNGVRPGFKTTNPIGATLSSLISFAVFYFKPQWRILILNGAFALFQAFLFLAAWI
ncbi:MAG: hypothetical protein EOP06_05565 [Proteobacteria bacterium]|nr:MAG: hypothetical protein EOP06_05565 [Pseudomonadota bacterium]